MFKITGNNAQCPHIVSIIYFKNYIRQTNISGSEVMLAFKLLVMLWLLFQFPGSWHLMLFGVSGSFRGLRKSSELARVLFAQATWLFMIWTYQDHENCMAGDLDFQKARPPDDWIFKNPNPRRLGFDEIKLQGVWIPGIWMENMQINVAGNLPRETI